MNALLLVVTLVFTPDPSAHCGGHSACHIDGTIYLNEFYLESTSPLTLEVGLNPDRIHFPHFSSTDLHGWRQCGEAIEEAAGIKVSINALEVMCREVKHAWLGRSHLQ